MEAVAAAGSQEEVDALLEAMGGDPAAANLVRQFRGPPASAGQPPPAAPGPGMQLYQRDSDMRQRETSLRGGGGSTSGGSGAGGSSASRAPPQAVELAPPAAADKAKVGSSWLPIAATAATLATVGMCVQAGAVMCGLDAAANGTASLAGGEHAGVFPPCRRAGCLCVGAVHASAPPPLCAPCSHCWTWAGTLP